MRRKTKKLGLVKETLTELTPDQLRNVAGGAPQTSWTSSD